MNGDDGYEKDRPVPAHTLVHTHKFVWPNIAYRHDGIKPTIKRRNHVDVRSDVSLIGHLKYVVNVRNSDWLRKQVMASNEMVLFHRSEVPHVTEPCHLFLVSSKESVLVFSGMTVLESFYQRNNVWCRSVHVLLRMDSGPQNSRHCTRSVRAKREPITTCEESRHPEHFLWANLSAVVFHQSSNQ